MEPLEIPRPEPLPRPDLSKQTSWWIQGPDWTQKALQGMAAWWLANRELRNVFGGGSSPWTQYAYEHLRASMHLPPALDYGTSGTEWRPVRVIGEGAYGRVGLWQRRDKRDRVCAEMVIKKENRHADKDEGGATEVQGTRGLSMEALIQSDLNHPDMGNNINVNHLYDFKYNYTSNQYRYYMIFCPHGDLFTLRSKYVLFDKYLSELFCWHVLVSLLEGVLVLEQDPTDTTADERAIPPGATAERRPYTLHLDWKPVNVFLDYPPPKTQGEARELWDQYPTIKIADFGLARYTHLGDKGNPGKVDTPREEHLWWRGTPGYKPPEQTKWKAIDKFRADNRTRHGDEGKGTQLWFLEQERKEHRLVAERWRRQEEIETLRANGQEVDEADEESDDKDRWEDSAYDEPPNHPEQPYSKSHNLWCVGKIMFDLMTMSTEGNMQAYMDVIDEATYERRGNHFFTYPDGMKDPLNPARDERYRPAYENFPYSERLMGLVYQCLDPTATDRPLTKVLANGAREGRRWCRDQLIAQHGEDTQALREATKLYFKENEVNAMPAGPAQFPTAYESHYKYILKVSDPDWEEFMPPPTVWNRWRIQMPQLKARPRKVIERNGRIYYGNTIEEANAEGQMAENEILRARTKEQWIRENIWDVVKEIARRRTLSERRAMKVAKRNKRERLIDVLIKGDDEDIDLGGLSGGSESSEDDTRGKSDNGGGEDTPVEVSESDEPVVEKRKRQGKQVKAKSGKEQLKKTNGGRVGKGGGKTNKAASTTKAPSKRLAPKKGGKRATFGGAAAAPQRESRRLRGLGAEHEVDANIGQKRARRG